MLSGRNLLLVAIGGAIGGGVRYGAIRSLDDATAMIVALNALGSFLVGYLAGAGIASPRHGRHHLWPLLATGVAGGLTTFATFAVDVARRIDAGDRSALGLTTVTVLGAIIAVIIGHRAGRLHRPGTGSNS